MNNKIMIWDNVTDSYREEINTSFSDLFVKNFNFWLSNNYKLNRVVVDKNDTVFYLN